MRRAIGVMLIGLGVFSIVLAVLFPTVVVPRSKTIPLDTNVSTSPAGTRPSTVTPRSGTPA